MAVNESIMKGAYHISNNSIEYNPQRVNVFDLVVEDLDGVLRPGADEASSNPEDRIDNAQSEILLGLRSCTVPSLSQPPIVIDKGNSKIKFPGKPTFNDLTLTAYDLMGSDTKDVFFAWQNLCYNRKYDYIGNKGSYKKNCTLYEYTPAGEVVRYWEIKGAWPTSVTVTDFDAASDETAIVNVTLSIDWAEIHLPDEQ